MNAKSDVKEKIEDVQNIANISIDTHLAKIQHQPVLQELNNQNKPNATSIMDEKNDHLLHFPSNLVKNQYDFVDLGLRPQDYKKLNHLLGEYKDIFPKDLPMGLPPERDIEHSIKIMSNTKPINKPRYRLSYAKAAQVEKYLTNYVSQGFIRSSSLLGFEDGWIKGVASLYCSMTNQVLDLL